MMNFDETGTYVKPKDIHNNKSDVIDDQLSNYSNRTCKSKCLQYKATRPTLGNRYSNGQVRCQTCEIYLTGDGAVNGYCLCCNVRVRTKPRNSMYKEKFYQNIENQTTQNKPPAHRNAHDSWIDANEDYRNIDNDNSNEKKSTPVSEEIDESVKTFYEFNDFLENNLRPQANYQFVMLHELLSYGKLHKGEIAESLAYFNNKNTTVIDEVKYYFDVPVYDVLVNHGFVNKNDPLRFQVSLPYYSLNVKLEEMQRVRLLEFLSNQIIKYNQEHNIPENKFPDSNNMENFNWEIMHPKSMMNVTFLKTPKSDDVLSKSNIGNEINEESIQNQDYTPLTPEQNSYTSESIPTFAKICPKCNLIRITASSRQEFEEKIEKSFGYRSNDPDNPDKKIPQSWCKRCRNLQTSSNVEPEIDVTNDVEASNYVKEHRFSSNVEPEIIENKITSSDIADTRIFNFDDGELNIQNCKVLTTDTIKKDQILTNDEIVSIFKVGNMGGIRYTKNNNVIVLLSTHSNDYEDSMDLSSGFITYTGEGKGNQEIKNGNEKILTSQNTPMVFFKEVYQEPGVRTRGALDNKYKFIGVVKYHKYNWTTEKGRKVIKFVLEIIS